MFQRNFKKRAEFRKQKKIGKQVRAGIVPKGVPREEIWEALKATAGRNQMEMFGFLSAKVFRPDGTLKQNLGLQSIKSITSDFAEYIVQAMCTSGDDEMSAFGFHKHGSGSTAEADDDTNLVNIDDFGTDIAAGTEGATAKVYESVDTIVCTSAYEIREHGIFNTLTGGTMMDRHTVAAINVVTDDEVEWTFDLTINSGG